MGRNIAGLDFVIRGTAAKYAEDPLAIAEIALGVISGEKERGKMNFSRTFFLKISSKEEKSEEN